jgi:hypothetical protein
MNMQTSRDYPTRPANLIDRGAEMLSRIAGIVAFVVAIFALFYLLAN